MKYLLFTMIGLAVVFGFSFLISGLIRRKMKKKLPMILHIIISILAGLMAIVIAAGVYLNIHYSADNEAVAVFADSGSVRVSETNDVFFIDGKGEDTAFIFYPGAKVDSEAYLPLMKKLAAKGVDCFVIKSPLRIAVLDVNAAENVIKNDDYENILVGGHSMGGVAASSYAADNPENVEGVVLLASYPNSKISDSIPLLSIYGSEDKVLDQAAYKNAKENFPKDFEEFIINGGNHAYFGNYGEQSGDGKAIITRDEQQDDTSDAIVDFIDDYIK